MELGAIQSNMDALLEDMALGKAIVQFDVMEGRVRAQKASLYIPRTI